MINTIKFWCQKILPLVYDDSLSYYETLCKLSTKINEIIEQSNSLSQQLEDFLNKFDTNLESTVDKILKEMLNNGEFESIFSNLLGKNYAISEAYNLPYAQCGVGRVGTETPYGLQGACYDYTNNYLITPFINTDNTAVKFIVTNFVTGETVGEYDEIIDSHINDCVIYNGKLICTNSSGPHANYLYVIDYPSFNNGEYININIGLNNITYDGTYLVGFDDNFTLYRLDPDTYSVENTFQFNLFDNTLLMQGISYYNGNYYLSMSQWINSNQLGFIGKISIVNNSLVLDSLYWMNSGYEIEGSDWINGKLYCYYRTTGMCMITNTILTPTLQTPYKIYDSYNRAFLRVSINEHIYINSNAGFFCDGSEEHPFKIINLATDWIYSNFNQIIIHIIGNHENDSLTIINAKSRVYVSLENATINNVNIYRCDNVVINGKYISDSVSAINGVIDIQYCKRINLLNFSGSINTEPFIAVLSSQLSVKSVVYSGSNTFISGNNSEIEFNSNWQGTPCFNLDNCHIAPYTTISSNWASFIASQLSRCKFNGLITISGYNGAISEILFPVDIYFSSSCVLTDAPSGMSSGVNLHVETLNNTPTVLQEIQSGTTSGTYTKQARRVWASGSDEWKNIVT